MRRVLRAAGTVKSSDIASRFAPATEAMRNMIDAASLSSMKRSAYLISVARGSLVDEAALAEALRKHVIAGAAIDVLAEEPPGAVDALIKVREEDAILNTWPACPQKAPAAP